MKKSSESTSLKSRDWSALAELATIEEEPLRARRLLYGAAITLVFLVIWAAFAEIDTVTRGDGKVIPSQQVQIIGSQDGGVVSEILVRAGSQVETGDLLLRLDQTRSLASLGESQAERRGLRVRAARLSALVEDLSFEPSAEDLSEVPEIVAQERQLFDASMAGLRVKLSIAEQQLTQRRQELAELEAREQQLERELNLADRELSVTRPMVDSGAVAQIEILRLEREVNRAEGELRQTRAKVLQIKAAIAEALEELSNVRLDFVTAHREQLAETLTRLAAVQEAEQGLTDRVRQTQVLAPVSGTIKQLFFNTVGGVVLPGRDVIEIVPRDDTLLVQVRIRPQDIGFLAPGQIANVKVSAYDFVVYGGLRGRVEQISADTVLDEEENAHYEVTIRTERAEFSEDQPIIPGMTVEADIVTGKKTVLAYLMKPVLRAHQRSMSER